MGRFLILLACLVVVVLVFRHWQGKRKNIIRKDRSHSHRAQDGPKTQGGKGMQSREGKPKGRLVQDPETGEYHVEPDDKI